MDKDNNKTRIYELAKELNTTSKRLMEKLAEINVNVKNHMSLLEPNELAALYKHIGIIKHDEKSDKKPEEKKSHEEVHHSSADKKKDPKKDIKSAPRIIRTREINLDQLQDTQQNNNGNNKSKFDGKNDYKPNYKNDYVKSSTSNTSGLRPGFVRDEKPDFRHNKPAVPNERPVEMGSSSTKQVVPQTHTNDVNKTGSNINNTKALNLEQNFVADNKIQKQSQISEVSMQENNQEKVNTNEVTKQPEAMTTKVTEQQSSEDSKTTQVRTSTPAQDNTNTQSAPTNVKGGTENAPSQTNYQGDRPQGDRPQRPYGDRPQGDRQQRPYGDRPQGDRQQRPYGDRPQGDRQQRPYGDRPQGDRPQRPYGDRPYGDRPQGDRPYGDKSQGDRQQRPYGDRPYGDRPQGDRQQRPYGDRPQGDRPQRPYGDRPQGDRQQRPYGDRPQGDRPYGDRQQRPYGDRPQGDRPQRPYGDRPQGDRPQRPYGDRPQGDRPQRPYGDRPQGDRPQRPYGDRPQGDRQQRPYGDRPQRPYGDRGQGDRPQGQRQLDIPKPDATIAQEQFDSQRNEARREYQSRDFDKSVKREEKQKKEVQKNTTTPAKQQKFKPQKIVLEKKGVSEILSEEFIFSEFYSDDGKKKKSRNKKNERVQEKYIPPKAVLTSITIPESLTVKELAEALKKTSTEIIKKLMGYGIMATLNNDVDFETATIIADEFGVKTEKAVTVSEEDILFDDIEVEDESKLEPRPPVVVVMGHVDHGKTSLLDAIRSANVIDTEAGGITQHIGAYTVRANERLITFLDTPGHEAFTAMRARGAQVTDIAILVVAADDGVMPQTIEAINHAKAANVSIIVAINKIDKPGANPDKVKQELTEYGIVAEEWGGDAIMVPVSAKKHQNIDQLLEMVLLAADMLELKADPTRQAKGTVIEAKLDKERGPVATVLVQRGTLRVGDSMISGSTFGRIKAMNSDKGYAIKSAGPSTPVEILGFDEVPEAGELFYAVTDEKVAKQLVEKRKFKHKEQQFKSSAKISLDDLFNQIKEGKVKDLNIIVKADVQGSVEAVKQSLEKLTNDEVRVKIIHGGVGAITESDVTLAQVSNAIIIGFNVRPGANVTEAAKNAEVDMRLYNVIYKAIEDVQAAMKGMLEPTFKEVILGHIEIRQIFKVSGIGTIGGAYVTDGKVSRNSEVRVVRDGIVVHEGKLASLKRFKDDAKEVVAGYECGVSIERFNDIKEGDIIEAFVMEEVKR